MLLTILLILLVASLFGGWWGSAGGRTWGYAGWSPFGVVLIVLLFLLLTGSFSGGSGVGPWIRGPIIHDRR
jgi:hypothetical protein